MSALQAHVLRGGLGLGLGYILSRLGFSDFDELHHMFVFSDLRLLFAFMGACMVAFAGFMLWARKAEIGARPFHGGSIPGGILFGIGWAVTGACPSIALVQLGEGKVVALITLLGVGVGTWVYDKVHQRYFRWDKGSCEI